MIKLYRKDSKGLIILVLIFTLLVMNEKINSREDSLRKAKLFCQQGAYDDSIMVIKRYISKYETRAYYKKNVAEAYYFLAKVYFTVGEDKIVNVSLEKAFRLYPTLEPIETDLEFKNLVGRIKSKTTARKESSVTLLIPTGKSIGWYMDRGDEYFTLSQYKKARLFYQMVFEIDKSNPLAKQKIKECEDKLENNKEEQRFYNYLDRADVYLKKKMFHYALNLFLVTYENFPLAKPILAERLLRVAADYPKEWEKFYKHNEQKVKQILTETKVKPTHPK